MHFDPAETLEKCRSSLNLAFLASSFCNADNLVPGALHLTPTMNLLQQRRLVAESGLIHTQPYLFEFTVRSYSNATSQCSRPTIIPPCSARPGRADQTW
ncbi:hypothetical protein GQ44DRAFT_716734 [Phaeosphaeriaceae sp. PMI808]|nr:hypothetical protein GQ44DRAFT_716734 [Phaeosphaeriaceae sp. PMI808]